MIILLPYIPLVAYLPLYYFIYAELTDEGSVCIEQQRNRITIDIRKDQKLLFQKSVATYLSTAEETKAVLHEQLAKMDLFPIQFSAVQKDLQLPNSMDELVFNIRNHLNVFGNFFLWTGFLFAIDVSVTVLYLLYWIFGVRSYEVVNVVNPTQQLKYDMYMNCSPGI